MANVHGIFKKSRSYAHDDDGDDDDHEIVSAIDDGIPTVQKTYARTNVRNSHTHNRKRLATLRDTPARICVNIQMYCRPKIKANVSVELYGACDFIVGLGSVVNIY